MVSEFPLPAGSAPVTTTPTLIAHIRRLSRAGPELYVRIDASDITRLGLQHGQAVEFDMVRVRITGIVKTSGGSPWLGPGRGNSNAAITAALRGAGFENGVDCRATVRLLDDRPLSISPARATVEAAIAHPSSKPMPFGVDLRIDPRVSVQCIREYNAGIYRGRRNIEIDREAYDRFRNGLSQEFYGLVDQLAFVADQYGGIQRRFLPHDIRAEAKLVADKLTGVQDRWVSQVMESKPFSEAVPSEETLSFLLAPFNCTMQWAVWASKTLHFMRPHVFPILDSKSEKAMGLALGRSAYDYYRFCLSFRDVLLRNSESLAAARIEDKGLSPSDIKLLDKILYQIGLGIRC
jgi:hypothetical protein